MTAPRCIVCVRVSTPDQEESGTSLESQTIAGEARVKQMGGVVVGYCIEAGVSGSLYETRPDLQEALARLERKEADVLVWYDLTRMSRDIEHIQAITRRIDEAGGKVVFCTAEYADGSDGFLARGIMGVVSHAERLKIRERTMQGKKRRAEQGVQPNRARRPYGYDVATHKIVIAQALDVSETGKYTVREDEAATVRAMFDLIDNGGSVRSVQRWLYEHAIPSPTGNAHWSISTIARVLGSRVYIGDAGYGGLKVKHGNLVGVKGQRIGKKVTATPGARIPIKVPAIVSVEQWERCQAALASNQQRLGGNPGRRSMLAGLLRCAFCGGAMSRQSAGIRQGLPYSAYRCASNVRLPSALRHPFRQYGVEVTDAAVLEIVWSHVTDPALMAAALDAQRKAAEARTGAADIAARMGALKQEIAALQKSEGLIVEAQLRAIEAGVSSEVYEKRLGEVSRARAVKQDALNALAATVAAPARSAKSRAAEINSMAVVLRETLFSDEALPGEKHDVLTHLIERIVVGENGEFEIEWRA